MGAETDSQKVPRLGDDTDIRTLPIDPFEGFMVSRIDGRSTVQEVADSTGADVEQVMTLVQKLVVLGAMEWVVAQPTVQRPSKPAPQTPQKNRSSRPPRPSRPPARVHTRPPPPNTSLLLYDPAELEEEGVDLDVERRRAILDSYHRLEELNYYDLLAVPRNADKKVIRDRYFKLSKQFHPDTLFGKELGTYKQKMEAVFNAITKAYEVLGRKKKRRDYDLYLGLTDTTQAAEQQLAQTESDAEEMEATIIEAASAAVLTPGESAAGEQAPVAEPVTRPIEPPEPVTGPIEPPEPTKPPPQKKRRVSATHNRSLEEKRAITRELMRRRLRGSSTRAPAPPPKTATPSVERSREDLLRGLAGSLRSAARMTGGIDQAEAQVQAGRAAEQAGDLLGATNAYRLALSIDDNPSIRADYERVKAVLSKEMAENYEKQAKYEEEYEKWGAAALSWKKVAEGRPQSAEPLCRAANAIVRSGGDLKHARELAQDAVHLMPGSKKCRIVLAKVYIAAGMKKSAQSELEEAGKLDPSDEIVKNLLLDLKR